MRPKKAYDDQKRHAHDRDIEWLLSYEDWLEMWLISNQWKNRGKALGNYQMCRYGDVGAYSKHNCYIGLVEQNQEERSTHSIDTIKTIVKEYLSTNKTQYQIASEFGVDQSYVSRLVNNHRRIHGQNHSRKY
jgi:hypothetical protein